MKQGVIYGIFFRNPKRVYIGGTGDYWGRWTEHLRRLRMHKHASSKLQAEYDAQGEWSMRFQILQWVGFCRPDVLSSIEREWMIEYIGRLGRRNVLNMCLVGSPGFYAEHPQVVGQADDAVDEVPPELRLDERPADPLRAPMADGAPLSLPQRPASSVVVE